MFSLNCIIKIYVQRTTEVEDGVLAKNENKLTARRSLSAASAASNNSVLRIRAASKVIVSSRIFRFILLIRLLISVSLR